VALDLNSNLPTHAAFAFFYGFHIFFFGVSVFKLIERGFKALPVRLMFGGIILSFSLTTLYVATTTASTFAGITAFTALNADGQPSWVVIRPLPSLVSAQIPILLTVISDAIVIWRAWALFPGSRKQVLAVSGLFLFGTTVTGILAAVGLGQVTPVNPLKANGVPVKDPMSRLTAVFCAAFLALSLATNIITTSMILTKFWSYLKSSKECSSVRSSHARRALIVVIESGIVYCVPQALGTGLRMASMFSSFSLGISAISETGPNCLFVEDVLAVASIMFTAAYPSIVIFLVSTKQTIDEVYDLSTNSRTKGRSYPGDAEAAFVRFRRRSETTLAGSEGKTKDGCDSEVTWEDIQVKEGSTEY